MQLVDHIDGNGRHVLQALWVLILMLTKRDCLSKQRSLRTYVRTWTEHRSRLGTCRDMHSPTVSWRLKRVTISVGRHADQFLECQWISSYEFPSSSGRRADDHA